MAAQLYGSQEPTVRICPPYENTNGWKAVELMERAGFDLMPWQCDLLNDWMATTDGGRWNTSADGASVGRQNGKTRDVAALIASMMVLSNAWVCYTSHLQKTSTETFEEVRGIFESPLLSKYVKEIRGALGREEITLHRGAKVKFLARTRNGGRGQHADLWVCDEAQELTDEQQGSFMPILAASKNPKTVYIGTPPDDNAPGEVFRRIRRDALEGRTTTTSWNEWGVDEIGDVNDRARWAATNPSMGYLIQESTIAAECEQMAPDKFARERLGWWSESTEASVISARLWDAAATDAPPADGVPTYSVKFSPDGSTGVIAVCLVPDEGAPHVEVVNAWSMSVGIGKFAEWLHARWRDCAQIVIDGQGNAQALTDRLLSMGVPSKVINRPRPRDMAAACAGLLSALNEGTVTHYAQPSLNDAAYNCTRRDIGKDGGWGFRGNDIGDATLLEAVALARWGASTSKRNPKRKQRIG